MDADVLLGSTETKIVAALTRRTLDGYAAVDLTDLIEDTAEPRTTVRRAVEDLADRGEVELVRAGRRAISVKLAARPAVLTGLEHLVVARQGPRYAGPFHRTAGPYGVCPWLAGDYTDHPELVVHADLELPGEQYPNHTLPLGHARILADHIERILIPLWSVEPALQGAYRVGHSDRARALCRWAQSAIGDLPAPHFVLRQAAGWAERGGHHSIGMKAEQRVALDLKIAAAHLTRWAEELHELTRATHVRDDEAREVFQLRGQLLRAIDGDDDPLYQEHLVEQIRIHEGRLAAAREGLVFASERTSGFGGPADDVGNAGEALLSGLFDRVAQNLTEVATDFQPRATT
ncbi:hypothetical protein [Tsukamurella ocularis]|uniref:hypothetical protein n=1 Tax=Tsukamurella ocularis TaxID=1970234 RepID=UPI0021681EDC|nr:hypothetical protein [Tsukamurella ocularis]MCS3779324.1 hypothetical protein [Tsukamurella ocularis]MCS3787056.1 hypothetical protein [Tsukamurella ocularis]MCS3852447.1 hypothetical protein [Tsukamurella ocularis]